MKFFADHIRKDRERGQAMVEFAILLLIIMPLCAGMVYTSRLLTFEYWAQQEARFLAFEQTWVPFMAHDGAEGAVDSAKERVTNNAAFHRPKVVSKLDVKRKAEADGGLSDLVAFDMDMSPLSTSAVTGSTWGDDVVPPVLYARTNSRLNAERPWWMRRTSEWFKSGSDESSLVETAFASQEVRSRGRSGLVKNQDNDDTLPRSIALPDNPLERGFVKFLSKVKFGERYCHSAAHVFEKYNASPRGTTFGQADCAAIFDKGFGVFIARNIDFKEFFRDYEYQMNWGDAPGDALQKTAEAEIASQFYSFFDTAVNSMQSGVITGAYIVAKRVEASAGTADSSVSRMITDLRYIGSSAAIIAISGAFVTLDFSDPSSRDSVAEKDLEDSITDILHVDAANILPVIGNGFLMNPTYLPVPPTFGPFASGLFSGVAKNVFFHEDNRSQVYEDLIEQSNKNIQVDYDAGKGLFPAAVRRFNTKNKILSSHFYLVTQPWHITRQESASSGYREKGTEFDSSSDETDEAVLRRRVEGLWLIPSNLGALLEPITTIPELSFLAPVASAFEAVSGLIGEVKGFLTDNPLLDVFDALSEIPGFGALVPTPPKWPAVRPDAYPGSVEMKDDMKAGKNHKREFKDYVDEQRDFNPKPDPDFGDAE